MKIAIGSDHGGFALKQKLIDFLRKKGHILQDVGTYSLESTDYPLYAEKAARMVALKKAKYAILICRSGLGMCIAANKVKGIRAAVCHSVKAARFSREHNDANVLTLGAGFTTFPLAKRIVDTWLSTEFSGGRHKRRIEQISKIKYQI